MIKKFFKLKEYKTNTKTEIFAGLATFLAMAYILIVNPNNLLPTGIADVRWPSVFVATAIGSFLGTFLMSIIANKPFGAAPTMGVNAMIGTVIGGSAGFAFSYGNGMFIILMSGLVFFLLSIVPIYKKNNKYVTLREAIFNGTPRIIIDSIPIGIGLFIALIGLKNGGIISNGSLIDFGSKANWVLGGDAFRALTTLFGLIVIVVLSHYEVKGSVIYGIIAATILSIFTGVADINILLGKVEGISWDFITNIKSYFDINNGVFLSVLTDGVKFPDGSIFTLVMLIITFIMLDLFDTIGTIVGLTANTNMADKNNKPKDYNRIMTADSTTTCLSSLVGTSTVSTFVESSVGIGMGGRTGLTSLTISILFLLSIFILPVFAFIPIEAAASALIYVGILMFKDITNLKFDNLINTVPMFLTIIIMPLAYSITDGIGIGVIAYFILNLLVYLINLFKGKKEKINISIVTTVITLLFLIYFLMPTIV